MNSNEILLSHNEGMKKIGSIGPMNWQEGTCGFLVGWKRFTNSKW